MAYVDALSELEDPGDGSKPWCDLVFDLVALQTVAPDGRPGGKPRIAGRGMALARGIEIGFGFEIPLAGWEPLKRIEDADLTIHFGATSLLSIGEPTDRLVALYEDWFGVPAAAIPARRRNDCKAALLGGSIATSKPFDARIKLFFDFDDVDAHYAELFFSIDTGKKRLTLREKDPDYRAPLLRWLRSAA